MIVKVPHSVFEEFARRSPKEQKRRRSSSKSLGGRDPSLRWPHLYDLLVAKGYSKEKAARISNAKRFTRKKGRLVVKKGPKS
jgi:hypothetical protein